MLLIPAKPGGLSTTSKQRWLLHRHARRTPKRLMISAITRCRQNVYTAFPFTSGWRTFIEGFFFFALPAYNFVLLNISWHRRGLFIHSFAESCSFGKIWRAQEEYIFQTRPDVRRCGGMRRKHCILRASPGGVIVLHNIIVLDAPGRASWFLIKTCAVLFHILLYYIPFIPHADRENLLHVNNVRLYTANIKVFAQ